MTDSQSQKLSVRLKELEALAHSRRYSEAVLVLLPLLQDLDSDSGDLTNWCTNTDDEKRVQTIFTRIASSISVLLTDPEWVISKREFVALTGYIKIIGQIFYLSGFHTTDDVQSAIESRSNKSADGSLQFRNHTDVRRYFLGCNLYSKSAARLAEFAAKDPQSVHAVLLASLSTDLVGETRAQQNRHKLLQTIELIADVTPQTEIFPKLNYVWQVCSYASIEEKHVCKRFLNRMVENWLAANGIQPVEMRTKQNGEKPTLVVPCEVTRPTHVVYRCYAFFLRQLQQRFRVVAVVTEESFQECEPDWADEVIVYSSQNMSIEKLVSLIEDQKPDAVYYPIIGMKLWTVLLCNLRLADIQFASLGHPATTHSAAIDYMLAGSHMVTDENLFSEKIVRLGCAGNLYVPPEGVVPVPPDVRQKPVTIWIAVAGSTSKLNAEFLAACERIAVETSRELEFHFFPNTIGIRYQMLRVLLKRAISHATVKVHVGSDFDSYLENLNACDICLSPFPFGGENSTLDALQQGIPVVTLEGTEPAARLDSRVLSLAEAADWLVTRTVDDYIKTACKLIDDDAVRCELSAELLGSDIPGKVRQEHEKYANDFVETVWWMYQNHSGLKVAEE